MYLNDANKLNKHCRVGRRKVNIQKILLTSIPTFAKER